MMLPEQELRTFLEEKHDLYNRPGFIEGDPVSVPHYFTGREDREISGFLAATIAWGNRRSIVKSAMKLMSLMDSSPYDFIMNSTPSDRRSLRKFRHRTFQPADLMAFLKFLKTVYGKGGMEKAFFAKTRDVFTAIENCRSIFLATKPPARSLKHFPSPANGSAAKRLNMFLRWMVRKDGRGVDLGLWDSSLMPHLICPLDLHSGRVARALGILERKQDDRKAAEELTGKLRYFDPSDPSRFDFALFGAGIMEEKSLFSKVYTRKQGARTKFRSYP